LDRCLWLFFFVYWVLLLSLFFVNLLELRPLFLERCRVDFVSSLCLYSNILIYSLGFIFVYGCCRLGLLVVVWSVLLENLLRMLDNFLLFVRKLSKLLRKIVLWLSISKMLQLFILKSRARLIVYQSLTDHFLSIQILISSIKVRNFWFCLMCLRINLLMITLTRIVIVSLHFMNMIFGLFEG